MYYLVDEKTGDAVVQGDILTSFRGEKHTLKAWEPPRGNSTGRVHTDIGSYYPSVFGLVWRS